MTGVTWLGSQVGAKRLELLRQIVPQATVIGMLEHSASPGSEAERKDAQTAEQAIGLQLTITDVGSNRDIETSYRQFRSTRRRRTPCRRRRVPDLKARKYRRPGGSL